VSRIAIFGVEVSTGCSIQVFPPHSFVLLYYFLVPSLAPGGPAIFTRGLCVHPAHRHLFYSPVVSFSPILPFVVCEKAALVASLFLVFPSLPTLRYNRAPVLLCQPSPLPVPVFFTHCAVFFYSPRVPFLVHCTPILWRPYNTGFSLRPASPVSDFTVCVTAVSLALRRRAPFVYFWLSTGLCVSLLPSIGVCRTAIAF